MLHFVCGEETEILLILKKKKKEKKVLLGQGENTLLHVQDHCVENNFSRSDMALETKQTKFLIFKNCTTRQI